MKLTTFKGATNQIGILYNHPTLHCKHFSISNGTDEVQISLHDLVPGLYMIKYTGNDQLIGTSKLVVK